MEIVPKPMRQLLVVGGLVLSLFAVGARDLPLWLRLLSLLVAFGMEMLAMLTAKEPSQSASAMTFDDERPLPCPTCEKQPSEELMTFWHVRCTRCHSGKCVAGVPYGWNEQRALAVKDWNDQVRDKEPRA